MQNPIQIGGFEYSKDDKGEWIYKATPSLPLSTEKAKYRELPQYQVQDEIEGKTKETFKKLINSTVIDIVGYLKTI